MWNTHKDKIAEITGIKTKEDYKNNPQAQEKYQSYLSNEYEKNIPTLRSDYQLPSSIPAETLMMLQHFIGLSGTKLYLKTLISTKDYDLAQKAVDDSIKARVGYLPKNMSIKDYINKFNSKLNK